MKKIINILLVIVAIISLVWIISSNFDYEPIIVFISTIIAIAVSTVQGSSNAKIKGNRNKIMQKSKENTSNDLNVEGEDNEIIQY